MDEDFKKGLRGDSVMNAKDALSWAAGDLTRKSQEPVFTHEGEPDGFQIVILMALTGLPIGYFTYYGWIPWGYVVSFIIWAVTTYVWYKLLCMLPDWLSGTIMGLLLGAGAAYMGWYLSGGDLYWTGGAGLGVGGVMYFLFSMLDT